MKTKKNVSVEKMSKKDRKAYFSAQRNTWGALNPTTRKPEHSGAYNRAKENARQEKWYKQETV